MKEIEKASPLRPRAWDGLRGAGKAVDTVTGPLHAGLWGIDVI